MGRHTLKHGAASTDSGQAVASDRRPGRSSVPLPTEQLELRERDDDAFVRGRAG